ncbi:MAG: DEAD/DEAH box helicase family protein [Phycisphaerales bacterium]|nr:DEAD/DEAH box helicase family protein [Phycisphaerales bacterium]
MKLRDYQQDAVDAVYAHLQERRDNPCIVIPTGGGKTPVIATLCRDTAMRWNGRVVMLAHVKELLEQSADKLRLMAPDLPFGIYSAGLGSRDLSKSVTVAGIQSIHTRACELGPVDLIIVDEAHLIPKTGDGMYRTFIDDMQTINPLVRVVGLTATPYRLKSGTICGPDRILNHVCYEIGVRDLIDQGFLSPLRTTASATTIDASTLHVRGGEFVAAEAESLMNTDNLVRGACGEILEQAWDRSSILIFAAGVAHGRHIVDVLRDVYGVECGFITGDTPSAERAATIARFRSGDLRFLANINVLTTGFDAPNVDCVALLRPTMSPGLFYQMCGRGFRLAPDKDDCLVLDFAGNIERHGPVDAIRPWEPKRRKGEAPMRACPDCGFVMPMGHLSCPKCGHVFDRDWDKHGTQAATEGILSGEISYHDYRVTGVSYSVHRKRNDPTAPPSMRVDYTTASGKRITEWICLEHDGYPRRKAANWWTRRSDLSVPTSVAHAVVLAQDGLLVEPEMITVRHKSGERFDTIVSFTPRAGTGVHH